MKVAIIGCGTMGPGIAQACAAKGYEVWLVAKTKAKAKRAIERIKKQVRLKNCLDCMHPTDDVHDAKPDLIIEAIDEDLKSKQKLFKELDVLFPNAILATNTSSLSINSIARYCHNKKRVVGIHFMNPASLMPLVEIVQGLKTSDATVRRASIFAKKLGKHPIKVQDKPGFVLNRLLIPMINEAALLVQEEVAKPEDIDQVMKMGTMHPVGPLYIADLLGLDMVLDILNNLHDKLGDKYKPAPLIRRMVKEGKLGRRTKKGFYKY